MKYFGPRNPSKNDLEKINIPVESSCAWCKEFIFPEDIGYAIPILLSPPEDETFVYYHMFCFIRSLVGSVGHLTKRCPCYGGNEEDPPYLTKRQAAIEAARIFQGIYNGS